MSVNLREGFRRVCMVLSGIIFLCVLVLAWMLFPSSLARVFLPGEREIVTLKVENEIIEVEVSAGTPKEVIQTRLGELIESGEISLESAIASASPIPLYERINWAGILWVPILSVLAVMLPWMFYGAGVYISKGFKQRPS